MEKKKFRKEAAVVDDKAPRARKESKKVCAFCTDKNEVIDYKNVAKLRKYMTEKISGTYNLAFAYKKPMLCPEEMAVYEDFRDTSIFYTYDNFECFINGLSNNGTFSLYRLEKWKEEVQQNRLIEFINNL